MSSFFPMQFQKLCIMSLCILFCLTSQAIGQVKQSIKLKCGDSLVEIICGYDKSLKEYSTHKCNRNKLIFTKKNGKVFSPPTPKGFDDTKTAAAMSCGRSKKGQYYVDVEFSNGPFAQNIVIDMFESSGKRLTIKGKNADQITENMGIVYSKQLRLEEDE